MFRRKPPSKSDIEAAIQQKLGGESWLGTVSVEEDGAVHLVVEVENGDLSRAEDRRMQAESDVRSIKGVTEVNAVLGQLPPAASDAPKASKHTLLDMKPKSTPKSEPQPTGPPKIPGVSRILAVASAKGGVGKSTVSVNLAVSLAKAGMRVGLLDTDIYGPSVPTMLGTVGQQPEAKDKTILPVEAHGVKSLSIGYLADQDAPMIWRGPVVMSAITQMLNEGVWGSEDQPLDILIVDTPPGTGDAALTLAQRVPLSAALLVTTPQEVALADVRRGAAMFEKTAVPVLGIVETMSWFDDPTGVRHHLFGEGGGQAMAERLGLPLLAQLPIIQAIREGGDKGQPASLTDETAGGLFHDLARSVARELDGLQTRSAPVIEFID